MKNDRKSQTKQKTVIVPSRCGSSDVKRAKVMRRAPRAKSMTSPHLLPQYWNGSHWHCRGGDITFLLNYINIPNIPKSIIEKYDNITFVKFCRLNINIREVD